MKIDLGVVTPAGVVVGRGVVVEPAGAVLVGPGVVVVAADVVVADEGVVTVGRGVVVVSAGVQVCRSTGPTAGALTFILLLAVCRVSSKLGLCSSTQICSSSPLCSSTLVCSSTLLYSSTLLSGHQAPRQPLGSCRGVLDGGQVL